MTTLFNYDPYYDDFDENKNFLRVLFRPGYSVQARELTQLQTILANQIEKFGNHIFKNGSPIIGGKISLDRKANYIVLETQYNGIDIAPSQFLDKTIVSFGGSKSAVAKVIAVDTSATNPVLVIKYLSGDRFAESESLRIRGQDIFATLKSTSATGGSFVASIQEGVYYFKGQFVKVIPQFLVIETYYRIGNSSTINAKPSYKIGVEFEENIVDEIDDVSLLDPAQGAFNYQAPGANRFQVITRLSKRTIDSSDISTFFEVIRLVDDVKTKEIEYPVYSEIEKTLARRTYDESGNYTVDPFVIAIEEGDVANGKFSAILDPGKAYVSGYEFQTIAPTTLSLDRGRSVANAANYDLPTNYESSIVVENVFGALDITTYPSLDIHCVAQDKVNNSSQSEYNETKIGSLNVSMLRYNDSTDRTLGNTYSLTVNVFNANTIPLLGTLPASGSSTTTIALPTTLTPNVVNAYANMYFQITDGLGTVVSPILITSSNSATINLSSALPFIPASNTVQIKTDFKSARSLIANSGSGVTFAGDINSDSIQSSTGYAFITEPQRTSKIFEVPFAAIKAGTISDMNLYGRKAYKDKTSDAGGLITISASGTDTFAFSPGSGTISDSLITENILAFVRTDSVSDSASGIFPGRILALANNNFTVTSVSTQSFTIDLNVSGVKLDLYITTKINAANNSTTGAIRGKQLIPLTSGANLHAKVPYEMGGANTLEDANTVTNTSFSGGMVFEDIGATNFTLISTLVKLRTPGVSVSLQVPDVIEIVRITDSQNLSANVTTAMLSNDSYDVTRNYEFDTGQRKTHYDHATIKLKRGVSPPRGRVFVQYKYLKHSAAPSPQNNGLFTVDSYLKTGSNFTYDQIFYYNNTEDGKIVPLRSAFDFRPTRAIGGTSLSGAVNPEPLENISMDFDYYLGRIDHIVIKPSREFAIVQGKSAVNPIPATVGTDDMILYTLYIPPYTDTVELIRADFKNHRRYTMRDIDRIENRLKQLEYYVTLNALEKDTLSLKILDANGLERSKYGIFVDNFSTKDLQASREEVGYDNRNLVENGELRPASLMRTVKLFSNTSLSSGSTKFNGVGDKKVLTLSYTTTELTRQQFATKEVVVAGALFANFKGVMQLSPEFEGDVDTSSSARVVLNSTQGLNQAFTAINNLIQYQALNNTDWILDRNNPFAQISSQDWFQQRVATSSTERQIVDFNNGIVIDGRRSGVWESATTTTVNNVVAAGTQITGRQFTTSASQVEMGSFITDLAIRPNMKQTGILFNAQKLRPNTTFYHFFDGVNVDDSIWLPNEVTLTTTTGGSTVGLPKFIPGERVFIYNNTTTLNQHIASYRANPGNTGIGFASAGFSESSSNTATIFTQYDMNGLYLYGVESGRSFQVSSVKHRGGYGLVVGNTIVLGDSTSGLYGGSTRDSSSVDDYYNGNTINVLMTSVSDPTTWINEQFTITDYVGSTRTATLSGTPSKAGKFLYSIGQNKTDSLGRLSAYFFLPPRTFLSGQRTLRVTESFNNTYDADAISFAEAVYTSSGINVKKTTLVDTVLTVGVENRILGRTTSDRTISSTTRTDTSSFQVGQIVTAEPTVQDLGGNAGGDGGGDGGSDPLAQTFFVDESVYPNGIFLDSVDLFFKAKDDSNLPVTVQIRPTVNGTPSADFWYPESVSVLYPSDIKTSQLPPSFTNTAATTNFKFYSPVYLKPGLYAVVIITDSPDYSVWVAEKGKITVNNETVSRQPHIGTLYKSQNTMEYVPYINEDLMFRLNRCSFNTSAPAVFVFDNEKPGTNYPNLLTDPNLSYNVDRLRLLTNEITNFTNGVALSKYSIITKLANGFAETDYEDISPDEVYEYGQSQKYAIGNRRRKITNAGDFKVKLTLSTISNHVSPVVSVQNLYLNVWENFVDNAEISSEDFTIIDQGEGYTNANSVIVVSSSGTSANANTQVDANGNILSIYVTSGGSGYTDDFYITYPDTGNDANVSSNASIVINSEFDPSGGPSEARYITKPIVLADGFDSGDLKVYLAANKPQGTEVHVYYKLLSQFDDTAFKDRPYQKMTLINPSAVASKTATEFTEYEYRPSATNSYVTYTSDSGVTYDTFKTFAIKIVLTSSDPAVVPRVKDLRAIALPAE
jgi:hypothetical protein